MPSSRPAISPLLLAAAACIVWPAGAAAQACIGLPLEWSPNAVSVNYARAPDVSLYGARAGRALGNGISVQAGYTHGRSDGDTYTGEQGNRSTGHSVAATVAYRMSQMELPLCLLTTLRYARSTIRSTRTWWDDGAPVDVRDIWSGPIALMGVGMGRDFPVSEGAAVIPFATGQLGWSEIANRQSCSRECSSAPITEGSIHLQGEAGLLLQLGRIHLAGTYQAATASTDPLLRRSAWDRDRIGLISVGLGFVF